MCSASFKTRRFRRKDSSTTGTMVVCRIGPDFGNAVDDLFDGDAGYLSATGFELGPRKLLESLGFHIDADCTFGHFALRGGELFFRDRQDLRPISNSILGQAS